MKNDRFIQLCHFAAGAVLIPVSLKLFEQKKFLFCIILLFAALLFLIAAGALEWLQQTFGDIVKLIFLIESIVLLFTAFIQFTAGKKMPTIAYAAGGIFYFLLFVYFLYGKDKSKSSRRKNRKNRHHTHRHTPQENDSDE